MRILLWTRLIYNLGHVGWGISWYINGLLIPEINVVRGRTYTFIVEGGDAVDIPARYHPFYITDDPIGGYEHKTPEEKSKVKIFAGVKRQNGSGVLRPTGVGRFCNWQPHPDHDADDFSSFGAYQRTLSLVCESDSLPGNVQWTPDENTPDTVYYQVSFIIFYNYLFYITNHSITKYSIYIN